jgi:hypothetical protein
MFSIIKIIQKKTKWSAGQLGQMSFMCYVISTLDFVHVKDDSFSNNKSKQNNVEGFGLEFVVPILAPAEI